MSIREADYQRYVIKRLRDEFPGCFVLKNDSSSVQGIPDLLVLYRNAWAMLEIKVSQRSRIQPNQRYYIDLFDKMSFAAFLNPENEEEVFRDLQSTFAAERSARFLER